MKSQQTKRHTNLRAAFAAGITALVTLGIGSPSAWAQRDVPGVVGQTRLNDSAAINAAQDVNWDQRLDNQVTLSAEFRDENDKTVKLGDLMKTRPVVLVLPFYKCPGICTAELNGLVDTMKDEKTKFRVGRDFDVVTISINPKEKGDLATAKKKEYLDILGQPGAENGWHFLTGDEASIKKVADDIGFRYKYDPKTDQYAHPGGIVLLTPHGKVSRYFFGVAFSPKDVRLGLTEAGQGRIGSVADRFVLACYHYDPQTGKYGPAVFRIMQVLGFATVFALGSFMLVSFRQNSKEPKLVRGANGAVVTPGGKPADDDAPTADGN
jgi:protein SCO1/2